MIFLNLVWKLLLWKVYKIGLKYRLNKKRKVNSIERLKYNFKFVFLVGFSIKIVKKIIFGVK